MTDGHGTPFTRLQLESLRSGVEESLHLLPCQIHRQGVAKVDKFFSPAIRAAHGGKEVSFRGRKLRGQEVTLPAGYMGVVLKEDHKPCAEEEDRCLNVRSIFQSFTQWNLETPPSADDVLVMSLAWPKIASAIHAPVE